MLDLSEIKKIASQIDKDSFFLMMKERVDRGEYDSYISAISAYIEERDLIDKEIRPLISPLLRNIIEKEAVNLNLLKDSNLSTSRDIKEFL